MTLYEISDEFLRLSSDLDDVSNVNIDIALGIDLTKELANIEMQFSDKVENIIRLIKNWESEKEAISNEVNRLQNKSQAIDNRIVQIKEYLQSEMIRTKQDSIKAGIFKVRLQNSPLGLIVNNVDAIPDEWKEIISETKVDKKGILRHLKETGEIVEGVNITQNKHIRIY